MGGHKGMQRYQSNEENVYGGKQPLPQEEADTAPTEQLYPDYGDELPPLPPRVSHHRLYQPPASYERPSAPPETVYDSEPEPSSPPRNTITFSIAKFNQFLKWLLWVIEVMFTLRFFLSFVATSNDNAFISLLTKITDPLLAPFETALRVPSNGGTGIQWYILLAMLIYFLVITALVRLLRLFVTEPEL
jgi:uncharacterized protein YggT (Ycf19 family)